MSLRANAGTKFAISEIQGTADKAMLNKIGIDRMALLNRDARLQRGNADYEAQAWTVDPKS